MTDTPFSPPARHIPTLRRATGPGDMPKEDTAPSRILAVSFAPQALLALPAHVLAPMAPVESLRFQALAPHHLEGPRGPDLVLSPLETANFDAFDLIETLSKRGYAGRYLAISPALPDPELIRSELMAHGPGLNLDLVILDGRSSLRLV